MGRRFEPDRAHYSCLSINPSSDSLLDCGSKMQNSNELPIISSVENLKFLPGILSENEIIDLLSDIKHRVFPRPFERLAVPRGGGAGANWN